MRGRLPSLRSILQQVRRTHPGRVLDVRLKGKGSRRVYELKVLGRDNRVRTVRVPLRVVRGTRGGGIVRNYNFTGATRPRR